MAWSKWCNGFFKSGFYVAVVDMHYKLSYLHFRLHVAHVGMTDIPFQLHCRLHDHLYGLLHIYLLDNMPMLDCMVYLPYTFQTAC